MLFIRHIVFLSLTLNFVMVKSSLPHEIYPFKNNPKLSWSEFEKSFREKYPHLDVPKLILDDDCDFAPMYIHDPEDEYLTKFNEHRADKQKPPFIIMNIKTTGLLTPEQVEYVLLHEAGHHNYDRAQNEQNHARAKSIANTINNGFSWTAKSLNLGFLCHNAYRLSQKTMPKKALVAQALAFTLYSKMAGIQKSIDTLCDDVVGTRPEEFAADNFANQHATKQTLQAAYHLYSKECFINRNYFDFVQDLQADKSIQDKDPEAQRIMFNLAQYMNSLERSILAGVYNVHGLLCPSHPSPSQRRYIVGQALKDRFGTVIK
jgi:hypothetical protein